MKSMISICAPCWKRQEALDEMVAMYDDLYPDLEGLLEISICDDGSPEPMRAPTSKYHRVYVSCLRRKDAPLNPCVPINMAVSHACGEIIVLTNPEVRHDGPVLLELINLISGDVGPLAYATARCRGVGYGSDPFWLAGPEVDYSTAGRLPVPPRAHFHFLAAFWRELWDKAGGFDEDYRNVQACDDNDWLWRAHRVGARFHEAVGIVRQPKSSTRWNMPHGRDLFLSKWPDAVRRQEIVRRCG